MKLVGNYKNDIRDLIQGSEQYIIPNDIFIPEGSSESQPSNPPTGYIPNINFSYNEILCNTNPLGIKGAGEAGAIGAPPAVINAICNALNLDHIDMPAKPEKIWHILSSKQ